MNSTDVLYTKIESKFNVFIEKCFCMYISSSSLDLEVQRKLTTGFSHRFSFRTTGSTPPSWLHCSTEAIG
jgi:hypothetical protein